MSTRCTIKVEGVTYCKLYKHFDGYPEATLPWLENFNEKFTKKRGIDPSYKMAQLLRDSVRKQKKYDLDKSATTGWGIVKYSDDMGSEYVYILKDDGFVEMSVL